MSGTSTGYETFVRSLDELRVGKRSLLTLRSLAPGRGKYLAKNVVALVTHGVADGAEPLVVRSAVGHRYPGTWSVRIVEELPLLIPGRPYEDAAKAMLRAWGDRLDR